MRESFWIKVQDELDDCEAHDSLSSKEKYIIHSRLAGGGMKDIFIADDLRFKRKVAIAQPKDKSAGRIQAFLYEARITASLQHPNILPVYDSGELEDVPFFVMKILEGRLLTEIISEREHVQRLTSIFSDVVRAVIYAHNRGVYHLDLKPENIFVDEYNSPVIFDWGLAEIDEGICDEQLLEVNEAFQGTRGIKGTPGYLSPEQTDPKNKLDGRSDIYSLGAILYAMLTGRPPVSETDPQKAISKIANGEWETPSKINAVPGSLEAICCKSLQTDKKLRYQSVKELFSDLELYQQGFAPLAESASPLRKILLMLFRHRRTVALIAVFLVLTQILITYFLIQVKAESAKVVTARNAAEKSRDDLLKEKKIRQTLSLPAAETVFRSGQRAFMPPKEAYEKAYRIFKQTVYLDPNHAYAWDYLCAISLHSLDFENAYHFWEKHTKNGKVLRLLNQWRKDGEVMDDELILERASQLVQANFSRGGRLLYLSVLDREMPIQKRVEFIRYLIELINNISLTEDVFTIVGNEVSINLEGYEELKYLPSLRKLKVKGINLKESGIIDLGPLKGTGVRLVNLSKTSVSNLSALYDNPLEEIRLSLTSVARLSNLKVIKSLKRVYIPRGQLQNIKASLKKYFQIIEE